MARNRRTSHAIGAWPLRINCDMPTVETSTPPGTPTPIGPYSHIAKVGTIITIGGTAAFNPATGQLVGDDVATQTTRILETFRVMLASVGSDLAHVVHVNVFLKDMADFAAMNAAYAAAMGAIVRPGRPSACASCRSRACC